MLSKKFLGLLIALVLSHFTSACTVSSYQYDEDDPSYRGFQGHARGGYGYNAYQGPPQSYGGGYPPYQRRSAPGYQRPTYGGGFYKGGYGYSASTYNRPAPNYRQPYGGDYRGGGYQSRDYRGRQEEEAHAPSSAKSSRKPKRSEGLAKGVSREEEDGEEVLVFSGRPSLDDDDDDDEDEEQLFDVPSHIVERFQEDSDEEEEEDEDEYVPPRKAKAAAAKPRAKKRSRAPAYEEEEDEYAPPRKTKKAAAKAPVKRKAPAKRSAAYEEESEDESFSSEPEEEESEDEYVPPTPRKKAVAGRTRASKVKGVSFEEEEEPAPRKKSRKRSRYEEEEEDEAFPSGSFPVEAVEPASKKRKGASKVVPIKKKGKAAARKGFREVVLDTETTGLSPEKDGKINERMVEFAAIETIDGVPTENKLHLYINPDKWVPDAAFKVHRLSSTFLKRFPRFSEVADKILAFIGDAPIVAHNGSFDLRFINAELKHARRPQIDPDRLTDTLKIARRLHPNVKGKPRTKNSLDALCARYNIDNHERLSKGKHSAMEDTELLVEVYQQMKELAEIEDVDLSDLVAA